MTAEDAKPLRCLQLTCDWINRHPSLSTTSANAQYAARVAAHSSSNIICICSIQKPGFLPAILGAMSGFAGVLEEVGIDKLALLWDTRVWRKTREVVVSRPGKFVHVCLEHVVDETEVEVFGTNQNAVTPSALKALAFAVASVRDEAEGVVVLGAFERGSQMYGRTMQGLGLVDVMKVNEGDGEEEEEEESEEEEEENIQLNRVYASDVFEDARGFVLEQCERLANAPVVVVAGEDEEDIVIERLFEEEESDKEEEENLFEAAEVVREDEEGEAEGEPEREATPEAADAFEAILREASQAMTKAKALLRSDRLEKNEEIAANEGFVESELPASMSLDVDGTVVEADVTEERNRLRELQAGVKAMADSVGMDVSVEEDEATALSVEHKLRDSLVSSAFEEEVEVDDVFVVEEKELDAEAVSVDGGCGQSQEDSGSRTILPETYAPSTSSSRPEEKHNIVALSMVAEEKDSSTLQDGTPTEEDDDKSDSISSTLLQDEDKKSALESFLENSRATCSNAIGFEPATLPPTQQGLTHPTSLDTNGTPSYVSRASESTTSVAALSTDTKEEEGDDDLHDPATKHTVEDFFAELAAVKNSSNAQPELHFSFAKVLSRVKKQRERLQETRAKSILSQVGVSPRAEQSKDDPDAALNGINEEWFEDRFEDRVNRMERLIQEMDSFTATLPEDTAKTKRQEVEVEAVLHDMIGTVVEEVEEALAADEEDVLAEQLREAILNTQEETALARDSQVLEVSRESPGVLLIKTMSTTAMSGVLEGSESDSSTLGKSDEDRQGRTSQLFAEDKEEVGENGEVTMGKTNSEDMNQESGNDADNDISRDEVESDDEESSLHEALYRSRPPASSQEDVHSTDLSHTGEDLPGEEKQAVASQDATFEEMTENDVENPALDAEPQASSQANEPVPQLAGDEQRSVNKSDAIEGPGRQIRRVVSNDMPRKPKRRLLRRPSEDDSFAKVLSRYGASTEVEEQQQYLGTIVSHMYGFNSAFTSNHRICHRVVSSGGIGATAKLLKQPSGRKTSATVLECFKLFEGLLNACPELLTAEDVGAIARVVPSAMHEHVYDPRVQESGCRVLAGLHEVEAMPTLVEVLASDRGVASMSLQTVSVLVHVFTEYQLDNRVLAAASTLLEKLATASPQSAELLGEGSVVKTLVK